MILFKQLLRPHSNRLSQLYKPTRSVVSSKKVICASCFKIEFTSFRTFHTTQFNRSPILPIPAIILGALKTGKLVSLVSLSSKTSLTLLPHTFRRGNKGENFAKVLAGIPIIGFLLLLVIGLDQAPNTSRLRLIYLSEEEELDIVEKEINNLLESQSGLIAPKDSEIVMWLQTIVDNLSIVAMDDIRDQVRNYDFNHPALQSNQIISRKEDSICAAEEEKEQVKNFDVSVIWDSTTVNAMCAGSKLIVYNLLIQYMEYDTTKMAVILSHEIAHSIQRHFVEQHGFASLMFMLGDITRGVFWIITDSLGPYINQKINEYIATFITLETQTTYNRKLEKEADLVGLKLMAKAGYDPRVAITVWQTMAALEVEFTQENNEQSAAKINRSIPQQQQSNTYKDIEYGTREFLDSLVSSWFGTSHPPTIERIEYMQDNLEEAIELYEQAIKLNGTPKQFIFSQDLLLANNEQSESFIYSIIKNWFF